MSNEALVKQLRKLAPICRGQTEIYIEKAADEIERLERLLAENAERIKALNEIAYQGINRHNECLWTLRGLYAKDGESFIEAIDRARSANDKG